MNNKMLGFIVFSLLTCSSGTVVFADSKLKDPEFSDKELMVSRPERKNYLSVNNRLNQQKAPIYLSKSEVEDIKVLQEQFKEAMIEPTSEKFIKKPVLKDGVYELGVYNQEALKSFEKKLNFYRELAGLKIVPMTAEDNEFAQYGAIGLAAADKFTHFLSEEKKPDDMPEAFWIKAGESTQSSNLFSSGSTSENREKSFNQQLDGYITDSGDNNVKVGHRVNVLGLQGTSFGVGHAKVNKIKDGYHWWYSTLYMNPDYKGISSRYEDDFILEWPTDGNFPIQLYNRDNKEDKNMRWSVSFNNHGYKLSNEIEVEILNNNTNEKTDVVSDSKGGELLGYGATPGMYPKGGYNTVVFKPNDDFKIESNTKYTVKVSGIIKNGAPYTYTYTTHMVDMDAEYIDRDGAEKELAEYKKVAKENLSNYKNKEDYRKAQQEELKAILDETNEKIDKATDKAGVDSLVSETKTALDKVKTDAQLTAEETETSAKELAEYKKVTKENLSGYKNKEDYRDAQQEELKAILDETNKKIDKATDKAGVDSLVLEAKTALDKVKTDAQLTAEETETSAKELAEYKKVTKENLSNYKNKEDYRDAQQEELKAILDETNEKIEKATDKAGVDSLVSEAKTALDKVKTDAELTAEETETSAKELAEYKKVAKENLSNYKNKEDYRKAQQEELKVILDETNEKIDEVSTKSEVDTLVEIAKTALDKVKTDAQLTAEETETSAKELTEYKKVAKENLSNYKNKEDYRKAQQEELKVILDETNEKIDKATDKAGVDSLVSEAKTALDKVKTDAQLTAEETETSAKELAEYKKVTKENLSSYKNKEDYRKAQQEELKVILDETNEKIDKATDKAGVDSLVSEAKTALDKVKTDAQLTAEENQNQGSAITYIDAKGTHVLKIDKNSRVKISASSKSVTLKIDRQKIELTNLKEITFKGITVDCSVPFYMDGLEKVTIDNVTFKDGVDLSGMKDLETLIVKNSTFSSTCGYSLAVHNAPKLKNVTVDKSTFEADFRVYSNKSLETSTLSNSVFKKDVKQSGNKHGYETKSINNRFERSKTKRDISSSTHINPTENGVGNTKFDVKQAGFIGYTRNGVSQKIDVPAGVQVTSIDDSRDTIKIKLSNGKVMEINGSTDLRFENVDIQTAVSLTSKKLQIKKVAFINSRTQLIDIACSRTITDIQVINTEISQKTGYLNINSNDALKNIELKNSKVTGTSGYISVRHNKNLSSFEMTDTYTHGYLSAYSLGNVTLQVTNSLFDGDITTDQNIGN